MRYELYIDVFFLINFVMDFLVLHIEKRVLKCTATHGGILLGALLGAAGACLLVCLPLPSMAVFFFAHALVSAGMVRAGLGLRTPAGIARGWLLLYLIGFLLGGVLLWLRQYAGGRFRFGLLFAAAVILSGHLVSAGFGFLEAVQKRQEHRCDATLYLGDKSLRVRAVVDSGNGLRDTLTGKPVNIISKKAMEKLTDEGRIRGVRYIPYHTIQKGTQLLPVIVIERMRLHGGQEREILRPLLGISGQLQFGNGSYDLILHPEDC